MKCNALKIAVFSVLFFISSSLIAQFNYVSNPSFENYDTIPLYLPDSTIYDYYYVPRDWSNPVQCWFYLYKNSNLNHIDTTGTGISLYGVPQNPWDYCWPVDGDAYASMSLYNLTVTPYDGMRMYLENKLATPLEQGKKYCLGFYVTSIDSGQLSIDQIGVYFSIDSIYNLSTSGDSCYLFVPPQIVSPAGEFFETRDIWYKISGIYEASGGEQYMTIGNFKDNGETNFIWLPNSTTSFSPAACYEIDMVTLFECDTIIQSAFAGNDTSICFGDSIVLRMSDSLNGYNFNWTPGEWLNDSTIQNPIAFPEQTTTYYLQQNYYSNYITTDEITITVLDCNTQPQDSATNQLFIPNVFSPNGDGKNDILYVRSQSPMEISFGVYNRWGNLLFETKDITVGWDGRYKNRDCPDGVYFYVAEVTFSSGESVVKKGNVTIVR